MHRIGSAQTAPAHPVQPAPFSLEQALRGIRFDSIRNERPPTFTFYRGTDATGVHQRRSLGHAVSVAYDVLAERRARASRSDAKAINRTMTWLGPSSVDQLGCRLLNCFTYLGAIGAGTGALLERQPANRDIAAAKREISDCIVNLAIKVGRCESAPDGFYHGNTKSMKVTKAAADAEKATVRAVMNLGGQNLFGGVAQAVLARPMLDSLVERDPLYAAMMEGPQARQLDIMSRLHPSFISSSEATIRLDLEIGSDECIIEGLFELLKMPEFVLTAAPVPAQVDSATQS